jgi:DNA primase
MQTWVDFAAVKRSVALAPLLRRYRVELHRSGPDQYRGCCPIHRGQGREAFHANLRQNVFHCFACGAGGGVLDFVAAMERCSLREAALQLARETAGRSEPPAAAGTAPQLFTKGNQAPAPLGFSLRGIDTAHPYLAARGVETATAQEFGIGFYGGPGIFSGRLVIPLHNERGELVAYCGRALDAIPPRYRFPPRFPKAEILFNLHRAVTAGQPAVVVVEGFFDCLKLHQAGIMAVVALMGAALYPAQQRVLLRHFRQVILMLDGDSAGRRATAAMAAQLQPHAAVQVIHLPDQVQPDQLSADAVREILQAPPALCRIC